MFWEDDKSRHEFQVTDEVLDLMFDIRCRELPVDHAHALGQALLTALPWLAGESRVRVHSVHLAGSQNGWERPDPTLGQKLILSRRTKLAIRVPRERREQIQSELLDQVLDIAGHSMQVGRAKTRMLSRQGTIFCRQVALEPGEDADEDQFLERVAEELRQDGIRIRKALCGKTSLVQTPDTPVATRSLMLADLSAEESVRLQQHGLGPHGLIGCGIFLPHKGIEAVKETDGD